MLLGLISRLPLDAGVCHLFVLESAADFPLAALLRLMAVGRLRGQNLPLNSRRNGLLLPRECALIIARGVTTLLVGGLAILELVPGIRALCSYYFVERLTGTVRLNDLCLLQCASRSFVACVANFSFALG